MKANFYKCVVIFCALLTTLTITIHATPTIALTETDSYETFVAAINSAENGDTVRLTNNINVSQPIFVIDKNITICLDGSVKAKSADDVAAVFNIKGGEVTIKSSSGASVKGTKTLFDVNDGANVSLDGIKMEKTSSNGSNYGVRAASGSTVEITNCSVEYHGYVNAPDTSFYGIYADSATISVKNTSFVLTQSIDGYVSEMYGIFGNVSSILRLSGINIIVAQSECAKKSKAYGVCSEGSGEISESQVLTYSAYTAKAISGGSEFSVISGKYAADGKNKSAVSGVSVKSGSFNTDPSAFVVGGGVVRTDGTESYDYEYEPANLAALDRVLRYVVEGAAEPCAHEKMTEIVVVEASCEQSGLLRRVCDNCDFYEEKEISALGHDCTVTDTKEPTCTADGYTAYKCSRCEYGYTEKQNMLGHDCTVTDTKEPTCAEDGYTTYKCSRCEYGYTEKRDKLGHKIVHHEGKTPTCLEVGYEEYDTCNRCEYSTYKELGKVEHNYVLSLKTEPTCISDGREEYECTYCLDKYEVTLPILGHNCIVTDTKEPTCTADGHTTYKCNRCEYGYTERQNMLGHDCIVTDTKEPTCTEDGYTTYKCSRCEYGYTDTVDKLGHEIVHHNGKAPTCLETGYEEYDRCSRCDYSTYKELGKVDHNYVLSAKSEPTCISDGKEEYKCIYCFDRYEVTLPMLGHDCIVTDTKDPTCTEDGYTTYKCNRCEYGYTEKQNMLGHEIVHHEGKTPTCLEVGYEEYDTCSRCDYSTYKELGKVDHNYVLSAKSEPTCISDGKEEYECTYCLDKYEITSPMLGHNCIVADTKEPTCTADGYTTYKCNRCEYGYTEKQNMLGHNCIVADAKEPTCTEDGYTTYKCSRCEYGYTDTVDKLGHEIVHHNGKAPTCLETGYEEYDTCSRCDYSTFTELGRLSHEYSSDWTVDLDATCSREGKKSRHCLYCSATTEETAIPKTAHREKRTLLKEATCDNDGVAQYECLDCGEKREEALPMSGHSYIETSRSNPSCETSGKIVYVCEKCGKNSVTVIPDLGHEFGTLIEELAPTCSLYGQKAHYKCHRCGEYFDEYKNGITEEDIILDKKPHDYSSPKVIKKSTCQEKGELLYTCLRCGSQYTETTEKSPHVLRFVKGKAATCIEDGFADYEECSVCDYSTKSVIEKFGHDYCPDWIVSDYPTCESAGSKTHVCRRCGQNDGMVIMEKLGHDFVEFEDVQPTCENSGEKSHRECRRCGKVEKEILPAIGHRYEQVSKTQPTCVSDGFIVYECANCGRTKEEALSMLGHELEFFDALMPTCTQKGHNAYEKCVRCDYTTYKEYAQLGHDMIFVEGKAATCEIDGYCDYEKCLRCGLSTIKEIPALGHKYDNEYTVDKQPSCDEKGEQSRHCLTCGNRIDVTSIPMKPHDFVKTVLSERSCETNYEAIFECKVCGTKEKAFEPMYGHDCIFVEEKQPTCTEDGYEEYSCFRCDYGYRDVLSKLGHDVVHHGGKLPSCEAKGWNEYETCNRCDYSTYSEIEAKGHRRISAVVENRREPTCISDGSFDRVEYCGECQKELSREKKILSKLGHNVGKIGEKQPTCTEDGYEEYRCSRCEYGYRDVLLKLGHNVGKIGEKQPTCTEDGYEEYKCSRCECTKKATLTKLGHDVIHHGGKLPSCEAKGWNEYETCSRCDYSTYSEIEAKGHRRLSAVVENRREPTCTSDGSFDHVEYCGECKKELSREKEILSKLGHNVGKIGEKQPTCTEDGYEEYSCSRCEYGYREVLSKLGHNVGKIGEKQPTCMEDGYEEYSCSRCEYTKKATLTKLGHDVVHHGGKLPSCEAKGWNEYETCSRCDYSTYSEIEAKGHRRLSAVVENRREPTCTSDGSFDHVEYCGECKKELSREKEILSKLGHNVGKIGEKQPTCTEDGYEEYSCSRCEYGYIETVFCEGHRFGDWKVEEGNHAKLCVKCGFKQSHAHEYGESETTKEPTLSDDGEQLRKCKVCGCRFIRKLSKINVTATCDGEYIDGAITASYDKETDEVTVTATEIDNKKFKGWYDGDICVCQEKTYTFARNSVEVKALYEDDKGETILLLAAACFVALVSVATVVGFRYKKRKK